jgi:hypothetical protein
MIQNCMIALLSLQGRRFVSLRFSFLCLHVKKGLGLLD